MTEPELTIERVQGGATAPLAAELASLRIRVFREFPYLYDGDEGYERDYLSVYARSAGSVWVLARSPAGELVGAATGIPLADEGPAFRRPLEAAGLAPTWVFYFGESILLPAWRGQGVGHRFFDEREAHAASLAAEWGFEWTAFAAVERAADDPRRPREHRGLEPFWQKRGYARRSDLQMRLRWREVGEAAESEHSLSFWLRPLGARRRPG